MQTPPCSIRPATPADAATILGFIRELAEFEHLAHEAVATEEQLCHHLFGPKPAAEVLLAEVDGRPVGFALYFTTFSTFVGKPGLYLEDLYVQPVHRRRGIGLHLLHYLAALAVQRDYGRLEWSVLDWNENALALYRRIGAVPMSDWTMQRLTGDALRTFAASAGIP